MAENKERKEPVLLLNDVEYPVSEMSDEQKAIYSHLNDLERKIQSTEFNLVQMRFGRQAFIDAFQTSLEAKEEKSEEQPEVVEEVPN